MSKVSVGKVGYVIGRYNAQNQLLELKKINEEN
jgi:hypothetical protein